ncbi:MAG TPA: DUF2911 domain-containing protein [Rubricoccaceae bacterium]|jgi:hypothetical protein
MRFLLLSLVLALAAPSVVAQTRASSEVRPSPNALVGQTIGTADVTLTYGRPSVRGRDVFGPDTTSLVPYGQVWRLGANEATTITVSGPVRVAGQPLAAGTYSVFAIPGPAEWTLVFNRTAEQWGAYRYDAAQDVLRVTATPEPFPHTVETFEIAFDDVSDTAATLTFAWDRVRVPVRIEADV